MSIPHHLLRNFDVELQDFYNKVAHEELGFQFPSHAERIETEFIRIHLNNKKRNSLRYVNISERCAYLLKYGPLLTSAFAYHFLEMVKNNVKIFDRPFQRRQLNLCCLGGGPASDVVALTKIIGELYLSKNYREPLHLKVTIVDLDGHWKTTSESVMRCIRRERSTFRAIGRMSIDFSFLQADLSKLPRGEVKEVIEKADLVTMVFFVSAVNLGSNACKLSCEKMITKIMTIVKSGSILFFMDAAEDDDLHFRQIDSTARELGDMEIIYDPCIEDLCHLSLNSVERFLELYHRYFNRRILCWAYSFISYCAWRKSYFITREVEEERIFWSKLKLQKNKNELSKRKGAYKSELNKVTSRSFGQRNRNATNQLIPAIERGNVQSVHTSEIEYACKPELNSKSKSENAIRKISVAENIERSFAKSVQERKTGENIQKHTVENVKDHKKSIISSEGRGESAKKTTHFLYITCPKCKEKITLDKNSVKDWLERESDRDFILTAKTKDITEKQSDLQQTMNNISESHSNQLYRNYEFDPAMNIKSIGKAPKNPIQKPRKMKSKDNVSPSRDEENTRYGQYTYTITDERKTNQERRYEESEFDRNLMPTTETQGKRGILNTSDIHSTKYANTVENIREKSNIHPLYNESNVKVTLSGETGALVKNPCVPSAPLKKHRRLKKSDAPSSNSHLNDKNEKVNEGAISDKIISKEICDSISIHKTQKLMLHTPKVPAVPLPKPRVMKYR